MPIPGLRGGDHIGVTVPDIDEAERFLVDVLGAVRVYTLGAKRADDDWMTRQLGVHARTVIREIRFYRLGNGANLEVFQYDAADGQSPQPRNSDIGGHHLAFYVDDLDEAVAFLRDPGRVGILACPGRESRPMGLRHDDERPPSDGPRRRDLTRRVRACRLVAMDAAHDDHDGARATAAKSVAGSLVARSGQDGALAPLDSALGEEGSAGIRPASPPGPDAAPPVREDPREPDDGREEGEENPVLHDVPRRRHRPRPPRT